MRNWLRKLSCLLVLLLCVVDTFAGTMVSGETGTFVFTPDGYFSNKPITVYYYKPKSAGPDAKVVIAIHGVDRSGKWALDGWTQFSEKNQLIVLAPEFDQQQYPERLFQIGGMEDKDPSKWTFSIIEQLFDRVSREEQINASTYILFGHSAGGQFVERFVIMMDKARYSKAIAANPGSHTMPVYPSSLLDLGFPFNLSEQRVDQTKLQAVMGRDFTLMLGERDLETDGPNVPNGREAKSQGANRFERGQKFFSLAKEQAARMKTDLKWKLVTVPGVGHSSRATSRVTAKLLFGDEKSAEAQK